MEDLLTLRGVARKTANVVLGVCYGIAEGVVVDFREPNVIRVAPAPLYNTFEDVWGLVRALKSVLVA